MPKTRNAFALRSFDEKRILQRPFFQNLNLFVAEDEEILESFDVAQCPNSAAMEEKLSDLRGLEEAVRSFYRLIKKHLLRLRSFVDRLQQRFEQGDDAKNYERACGLYREYLWFEDVTEIFALKFGKYYIDGEKLLNKMYRFELGQQIRQARLKAGITQAIVARQLRIPTTTFASYEQGRNDPPIPILLRIMKLLQFDLKRNKI